MLRLPALALLLAMVLALPAAAHADPIPAGAIVVTSPGDAADIAPADQRCDSDEAPGDQCTLRAAIQTANAKPGPDTIAFNLGLTRRIAPEHPLPPITQTVTIDGFTQAGMGQAAGPQVELDGSLMALTAPQPPAARARMEEAADVLWFKRPWGLDLRNADGSIIRGLIIHDFPYSQIGLDGTDQATISGNWLGLTPAGEPQTRKLPDDARIGLTLVNSAQSYIGGPGRERNVLSGNEIGLAATDTGTIATAILGNYIGTTWDGLGKRPNTDAGILLTQPVNTTGRGTRQMMVYANVIVGHGKADFGIDLIGANDAEVLGNFVGVNADAKPESPTGEPLGFNTGILVHNSPRTHVGGTGPAEFNLVSGNDWGLEVNGTSHTTELVGNRVGTNYDGTALGKGNRVGMVVTASPSGPAPSDVKVRENVIAGSAEQGLYIFGPVLRPTVTDNRLGTDIDGVTAIPNRDGFVAADTRAGAGGPISLTFGPGNIVAGNRQYGVGVYAGAQAKVTGNWVGLGADRRALGNGTAGVLGAADGLAVKGNVVSGNGHGIAIVGADKAVVSENRVGTGPDGTGDVGNTGSGILVGDSFPNEPTHTEVTRNVVAGNAQGIRVRLDAADTQITANTVGREDAPNVVGVWVEGGVSTAIKDANVLARNTNAGLHITGGRTTTVLGNEITHNGGNGVLVERRGGDAVIGHSVDSQDLDDVACPTPCNRIADNGGAGVRVSESAGRGITVRGNQMRGNAGLDVDLLGSGPTGADDGDLDAGGNDGLNHPLGVQLKAGALPRVGGVVKAADPQTLRVDLYGFDAATTAPLLDGRPRGGTFLDSIKPNSKGAWMISVLRPHATYGAIVTDANGSTSEMSVACADTTGDGNPDSDGDALCDNWETTGIDYDGDGQNELPLHLAPYSANPGTPDVFVEVDHRPGFKPTRAALQDVVDAFALAPTPIKLHLSPDAPRGDYVDERIPKGPWVEVHKRGPGRNDDVIDLMRGTDAKPCDGWFGRKVDRSDRRTCVRTLAARKLAFRHAIFVDTIIADGSGIADPGADAFLVGLDVFTRDDILRNGGTGPDGCNRQYEHCLADMQASTFMHELGHTLGLHHAGADGQDNYKPNYLSVMNYLYSWKEPVASRPLDFSRQQLAARNEKQFDEVNAWAPNYPQRAIGPWTEAAYSAYVPAEDKCLYHVVGLADHPVQVDGNTTTGTPGMGLNDADGTPDPTGKEACEEETNRTVLTGYDDWTNLTFSRLGLTGWDEGEFLSPSALQEAGPAELRALLSATDVDGDGVSADRDVCPAAADAGQVDSDRDGLGDACLPLVEDRDVEVALAGSGNVPVGEERTVTVTATNTYPVPADGATLMLTLPAGVELVGATPSQGTFADGRWAAGTLGARATAKLELRLKGVTTGRGELRAELIALAQPDWDSTPGNHDVHEDDQAAQVLTVFAGGPASVLTVADARLREGDDDERALRLTVRRERPDGATVTARVRTVDGTALADEDYEPLEARLELGPNQAEAAIDVTILGDVADEPDETFTVVLDQVDGATPETLQATVTIVNDDDPLRPGQVGWIGCVSLDDTCPQREPRLRAPIGDKALTPDGRFLFVADEHRIVRFARDAATGALGDATCWYTVTPAPGDACATFPDVLDTNPADLAITPDGTRLVTFEPGVGLLGFTLDPQTGALAYDSCSGGGSTGCTTPITGVSDMALSPDGRHVILGGGKLVVVPVVDGRLQPPLRCYAQPDAGEPCEPLAVELDGAPALAWAPDGTTLAVRTTDHLALLGFHAETGRFTHGFGCLTGACPGSVAGTGPVAFAPDGRTLYVASDVSGRVTALARTGPRTWALDGPCAGRPPCAVQADLVDAAVQLLVAPDGADLYVQGAGTGITALRADPRTGALSEPRCALGELGVPSCERAQPPVTRMPGRLVMDAGGRDLYTVITLPEGGSAIGRFVRVTRPRGAENRAPICGDAAGEVWRGLTLTLALSCVDPDGDPVSLRVTRGRATVAGSNLTYVAADRVGADEIGFVAFDGRLDSAEATARITIGEPPPACAAAGTCDRGPLETGPQPNPPARRVDPKLTFPRTGCNRASCVPSRSGDLAFTLRCDGAACAGALDVGKLARRVPFTIAAGRQKTVTARLSKAARRQLTRTGKLKLSVRVAVRLPGGGNVTVTRKLLVKKRR